MAQSQYYGTRGQSVKDMQAQLNAAGANIKVDGVWGPKTEAAYSQYGSSLGNTGAAKTGSTPSVPTYTPVDTSKLPEYTFLDTAPTAESDFWAQVNAIYDPQLQRQQADLETQRSQSQSELVNNMIKRGMGSSTYSGQLQNEINTKIADLLARSQTESDAARTASFQQLKTQDQSRVLSAQQYNNQLLSQQQADRMAIQQYNNQLLQQALADQLNYQAYLQSLKTGGSGGGGSGSGSKSASPAAPATYDQWVKSLKKSETPVNVQYSDGSYKYTNSFIPR